MRIPLLACVALLTACGGAIKRPSNYSEDAGRLLKSVEDRGKAVQSISAELKTEVWRDGERVKAKQMVASDPQGRLRIDVLSPFGHPLTTLVSDGSRLMIYAAEKKRFLIGASTPEILARLLPIRLSPEELGGLLRGMMPLIPHTKSRVGWNEEAGRYRLELDGERRRQRVEFEPEHLRVTSLETYEGDALIYRARFGDYTGEGDAIIPKRILFEVPSDKLRVDMTVVEHRINPALPDAAFHLEPPRGIPVEPL